MTRPPLPQGLAVYLDSHDEAELDETRDTLRRCGATVALPLLWSVSGRPTPLDTLARTFDMLDAINVTPMGFAFPRVGDPLAPCLAHVRAVLTRFPWLRIQWDIEPAGTRHTKQAAVDEMLALDDDATITTTRYERPWWDARGRPVWMQGERQTSMQTLVGVVEEKYPDDVLVSGAFDERGDPRTVAEIEAELALCRPQAQRTGHHGVWSAHTISRAKAAAYLRFALDAWPTGPARAA